MPTTRATDPANDADTRLPAIGWAISDTPVDYAEALAVMQARAEGIAEGRESELVWLLEHPPVYTAGTSAKAQDLLTPDRFPVHTAGRGGQYTYHGPGQRVVYVMIDVKRRFGDVRAFVCALERVVIETLASFNIRGEIRDGRVGVWVARPDKGTGVEDKIAAIGIRLRRWISFHGLSLNVDCDLEHFTGIVPCGIAEHGVTSLEDLGQLVPMPEVDIALKQAFTRIIGDVAIVPAPVP